ncbi:uncharacterized protein LOC111400492 [Olea europaea var. sylvestris]|uniref:uncharacterized protein LOC111400492 n=1 Tax=Olea europaea var. sylvestris TaxID=158386 RepID=UPI000C1D534E|nr:uncharacterized protein LOC111400492 [Olea europaea var. sylvestris]
MFVECVLKPTGRHIDYRTLGMVEQLDEFLMYPCGRKAYFVLLHSLQESQLERIRRMQQNNQAECKYSLHGYPLVFQYWIYESFPKIGRQFGHCICTSLKCPRIHKWQPQMVLAENVIKEFLATEEITVIATLNPTEAELETFWYTTLSLPIDNQHYTLDSIVNGELENTTEQIRAYNIHPQETTVHSSNRIESTSSGTSDYVTKQDMEQMFNVHRQDVFGFYDSLKTQMIQEATKQEAQYHTILENQQTLCQTLLDNQKQFFEVQQKNQQEHFQGIQSDMHSYVDTSFGLMKSYIDEQNRNMQNQLTNWKSHMESIVASVQHDLPPPTNQAEFEMPSTSEHVEDIERSTKEKKCILER